MTMVDDYNQWIQPPLRGCFFLTGPTSSGKTPLSLSLATRLNAEIISMDSMAVYQDMDIGTAKPTPEQQAQVPHHLIDVVPPTESFSVSSYVTAVHEQAAEIRARGKQVLICGGTPLYLKSLIRGLFLGPTADWEFRKSVECDLEAHGIEALRERLAQVDPLSAHRIHAGDSRRMIRALEVARATGKPLSHWQQQFDVPAPRAECPVVVLQLERSWLHERINQRVDHMITAGLCAEVESLLAKYRELGRTAAQAVGYREILKHLSEASSLEDTIEEIKAHTRQFARRQEIWFRGLSELQGLVLTPESTTEDLADQTMQVFEQSQQTS